MLNEIKAVIIKEINKLNIEGGVDFTVETLFGDGTTIDEVAEAIDQTGLTFAELVFMKGERI